MPITTDSAEASFAVRRSYLVDQVLSVLRSKISAGDYKEGNRLPSEADLCRQFNVGRSTIREALRVLSHLGLVETWAGKGTFVVRRAIDAKVNDAMPIQEIADIYQFRYAIEPVAAEATARRRTQDDLKRIHAANALLRDAISDKSIEDIVNRDFELHLSIVAACGNAFITKLYEQNRDAIVRALGTLVKVARLSDNASKDSPMALHDDLIDAIERQDASAALRAVRRDEREYLLLLRILEREGSQP